jgi:hypothetical protein
MDLVEDYDIDDIHADSGTEKNAAKLGADDEGNRKDEGREEVD